MRHIIAIFLFIVLIIISIYIERKRYLKLKAQLEEPLNKMFHTYYLIKEEETTKLIKAYTYLYRDNINQFKTSFLKLKILKEKQSKDAPFEDILKMITTIVPLFTIIVTLFIATFKESNYLTAFTASALEFVTTMFIAIIFTIFFSRIFNFSLSKANELISTHLKIAEETSKELSSASSD